MKRIALLIGLIIVAPNVVSADWSDDFDSGLSQPFVFGNFTNLGAPSPTFQSGAINGALQFFDGAPTPGGVGARVGFGVVPTESFTDVRVSGVLNPNQLPALIDVIGEPFPVFNFVNDDLALLARGNLQTGTSYLLAVSFSPATPSLVITRSDGFSSNDTILGGSPLSAEQFSFSDSVFLEFELVGASLTGRMFDQQGGTLIAEVTATDATYSAGVSGIAVERDDFANPLLGEFDDLSSVALTAAPTDADFNDDGDVDGDDFLIWQRGFGVGITNSEGDANGDRVVNSADLIVWQNNFGVTALQGTVTVPEPQTLLLVGFIAITLAFVRGK